MDGISPREILVRTILHRANRAILRIVESSDAASDCVSVTSLNVGQHNNGEVIVRIASNHAAEPGAKAATVLDFCVAAEWSNKPTQAVRNAIAAVEMPGREHQLAVAG